ncbi:hypothetical protein NDU88_001606 [Pleurodeles waltl]|uniref:Uncharacterized protein n=1 Tax=Pleurodeles waltl TaxID=8319 RepID=A0AAV7WMX9_PLEWA|nr:hypothetical protein NDU88_001606 [Pleurodeles waltl]
MAGGSALPKEKARADLCFSWLRVKDLPLGGTAVLLLLAVSLQAAAVTWLLEASPDIGDVLLKGNPHLKMQLVAASGSYPLLGTSAALVMAQFAFWEGASPSLPCWDQTEAIGAAGLAPSRSRSQSLVSFRPGSKVNQARPGTQDIHLPQGVAFHRSTRSPDVAAVQLARFTSLPPRGTTLLFSRVLVLSTPSNLNSPQQGDLGGQGLRHGPSPAPQAAQAVREGSRSSGSHSRLSRRRDAAHPASSSTTGGGGRRRPRGRDPSPGRAPALTGPHASKFKFPPAGGSRGPGPPPRPQPGTASRPGGQGGLPVLRVTLALRAPVRRRSPRAVFHDRRGGGRRHPRGRDPPTGRAPALTRPLAAPRPAADDFVGAPKPTSDPPGTARSGRHLELLFTGAAGSSYEGEPPAFHQFVPPDFSTGPRDTGAPCIALSAPLDQGN